MKSGQQGEKVFLNRWLWEFHRTKPQWKRVRLGPVPNPEMGRMFSVVLRWADALFIDEGIVNIVEAKLVPNFGAVGQLLGYRQMLEGTPEFEAYKNWKINLILLTKYPDLGVTELCSKYGIQHEIWNPEKK